MSTKNAVKKEKNYEKRMDFGGFKQTLKQPNYDNKTCREINHGDGSRYAGVGTKQILR